MTATLNDITAKKTLKPSAEEVVAAKELVAYAKALRLSLTGPDGCSSSSPRTSLRKL